MVAEFILDIFPAALRWQISEISLNSDRVHFILNMLGQVSCESILELNDRFKEQVTSVSFVNTGLITLPVLVVNID